MAKDHGPSVKNDKQYEGLRRKGIALLVVIAIGVGWSPIFAAIIAATEDKAAERAGVWGEKEA